MLQPHYRPGKAPVVNYSKWALLIRILFVFLVLLIINTFYGFMYLSSTIDI